MDPSLSATARSPLALPFPPALSGNSEFRNSRPASHRRGETANNPSIPSCSAPSSSLAKQPYGGACILLAVLAALLAGSTLFPSLPPRERRPNDYSSIRFFGVSTPESIYPIAVH